MTSGSTIQFRPPDARTEREVILGTLRLTEGNITTAARQLGISRRALQQRLERYGLDAADYR